MSFSQPYTYIKAPELAAAWKAQQQQKAKGAGNGGDCDGGGGGIAIVDVRDDDFEGGHIKGCWNVRSTELIDRLDEVVNKLQDAKQVVFHCSLSQARGPKAARLYREARDAAVASGKLPQSSGEQAVSVLRDGFSNFGAVYKNDAELVEGYDEESWQYR